MAKSAEVKYDIHVMDEGRWSIMTDSPTKLRAIDEGRTLLGTGKYEAVKVTEDRGQKREIIVWQEEAKRTAKATTIVPVDTAPVCTRREHFYRFGARKTAGRLLRRHLDEIGLTAYELVHDAGRLRALRRNEQLFVQAIQFVGNLQCKGTDHKPHERIDFLDKAVDELIERPDGLEISGDALKVLKKTGIAGLFDKVKGQAPKAELNFVARMTIAGYLGEAADWEGKLKLILDLADKDASGPSMETIDELVAEILDGSAAVQEILGFQRNLGKALQSLVQVAAGTFEISEGSASSVERLTALMHGNEMPETRKVIAERLIRELGGINPLTRSDDIEDERRAFAELMTEAFRGRQQALAGKVCQSATLRAKSLFRDPHGDESSEKAIDDMIALLPTEAAKFNYLLDLAGTEFGEKNMEHLLSRLTHVVDGMKDISDLVPQGAGKIDLVRTAAALRDRLLATKLPDEWRQRFAKKIYDLLMAVEGGKPAPAPKAAATKRDAAKPEEAKEPDGPLNRQVLTDGMYVFREGDAGDAAYLVVAGEVEILRHLNGEEVSVARAGTGSIIGEMALIDDQPRMASARAVGDTQLTVIPQKELQSRLERLGKVDPIMRRLVAIFVQRLRDFPIVGAGKAD